MTVIIPEYCFTEDEAADFKKRGKRCAEKGGPGCRSFRICGYDVWLPPFPFTCDRKQIMYFPGSVVLHVYTRRGLCVGAFKDLEGAQELMRRRGRNAGHEMWVCVDYSPRGYWITARVCIARIGRQLAKTLYVQPEEVNPAGSAAEQSKEALTVT